MRCSRRDSENLRPYFFTSTPISKPKKSFAFTFTGNSPIPKIKCKDRHLEMPEELIKYQNQIRHPITIFKVLGNKKIPLRSAAGTRGSSLRKQQQIHPPMVVISDSEEEDTISKEITILQKMFNPATKKSVKNMEMDQPKTDSKPIRNRKAVKPLQEGSLETDSKKSLKRVSRAAAIIDEVMNDRQSSAIAPSPIIKVKTEGVINVIAEKEKNNVRSRRVTRSSALNSMNANAKRETQRRNTYVPNILATGTLQDIGNKEKPNTRRTRKTASIKEEEKENNIEYEIDNKLEDVDEQELKPFKTNNINSNVKIEANLSVKDLPSNEQLTDYQKLKPNSTTKISLSTAEPFNETLPVLYKQEEIKDNEWIPISDQNGVFVKKTFHVQSLSNSFVKIESKSSWNLHSQKTVIFHVADGRGVFIYDNTKNKLGPGHIISIPSGLPCQILNSGFKKNLIISYTKING